MPWYTPYIPLFGMVFNGFHDIPQSLESQLAQEKKYAEAKAEYDEGIKRNPKERPRARSSRPSALLPVAVTKGLNMEAPQISRNDKLKIELWINIYIYIIIYEYDHTLW